MGALAMLHAQSYLRKLLSAHHLTGLPLSRPS